METVKLRVDPDSGEGVMVSADQDGLCKYWNITRYRSDPLDISLSACLSVCQIVYPSIYLVCECYVRARVRVYVRVRMCVCRSWGRGDGGVGGWICE